MYNIWMGSVSLMIPIVVGGVTFGHSTDAVPSSSAEIHGAADGQGILIGTIHRTVRMKRNGQGHTLDAKWSDDMKWSFEETTTGNRSLSIHLPTDGPFVIQLPVGSYRILAIDFESSVGTWRTRLPTTFEIRPQECTSLGSWEIQIQVNFVTGWITRHVFQELEFTGYDRRPVGVEKDCPTSLAPLESSVRRIVKLDLQSRSESPF